MPTYTWSAKDRFGQPVVREVEAETAELSRNILLNDGCSELTLKEDEIMAVVRAGFPAKTTLFGEELRVTAEDRLKYRDKPVTFWTLLREQLGPSTFVWLVIIAVVIYLSANRPVSILLFGVAALAWGAFLFLITLPSLCYRKLIKAADWSQWNEVLATIRILETVGRFSLVKVPATELTRHRAKALAGQGHLNEALAEFKPCEGRPDCPSWLYQQFVGSLYITAKRYDEAVECSLRSIAEKPTPTAWLDLAYRYARYKRNAFKARQALAEADKSPIPDLAVPFRARCLGVIAYLEGDYGTARQHLETAIEMVEKARHRPYRDGHLSIARAYLSCVWAKQGNLREAEKCFAQARNYLIATDETELLAECQQLINRT